MEKILVIQTAFIGDVILATAVPEKLHSRFPSARIDILVRKGNEGLFEGHPFINRCITWDKTRTKHVNLIRLVSEVRKQQYDLVVNLHRFATSGFITAFSGARKTVGFTKNPLSFLFDKRMPHEIGNGDHETERNQTLIADITDGHPAKPRLYPNSDMGDLASRPFVTISPASVWFTKQVPASQWLALISRLSQYRVYLLGGPGDIQLCNSIVGASGHSDHISFAGKLSLLQSAALMKNAVMNYVNDSAPLHLASAVNAPVTAVYCSTVPAFGFGPLSDNSHIVETKVPLACRPCGLHGYAKCPLGHFRCSSIEIADLIAPLKT